MNRKASNVICLDEDSATVNNFRRYIATCFAVAAGLISLLLYISHTLIDIDVTDLIDQAIAWQDSNGGVVSLPVKQVPPFKRAMLFRNIKEGIVDVVVLGPSSSLSITAGAFPADIKLYNASHFGTPLKMSILELKEIAENADVPKYIILNLDWLLTYTNSFDGDRLPPNWELNVSNVNQTPSFSLFEMRERIIGLIDAISLPQVRRVASALFFRVKSIYLHGTNWRDIVDNGSVYRCPDGQIAKDFDKANLGKCIGFRRDGSYTFNEFARLTVPAETVRPTLAAKEAVYPSIIIKTEAEKLSKISFELESMLAQLSSTIDTLKLKDSKVILIMPPHYPYMDSEFEKSVFAKELLQNRELIYRWSSKTGNLVLDFGKSELFGCVAGDFTDVVHGQAECYQKIFQDLLKNSKSLLESRL